MYVFSKTKYIQHLEKLSVVAIAQNSLKSKN